MKLKKNILLLVGILFFYLVLTAHSVTIKPLPDIYGNVTNSTGDKIGGALVILNVTSVNATTGSILHTEIRTNITDINGQYNFTGGNAANAAANSNKTLILRAYHDCQIGVNFRFYDSTQWPISPIEIDLNATHVTNALFDLGNDSDVPWEWYYGGELPEGYNEKIDLNTNKLNLILSSNCDCNGCFLNTTTHECWIPLRFRSNTPGKLGIHNISVVGRRTRTLEEVGYGIPFLISDGANWTVNYTKSQTPTITEKHIFNIHPNTDKEEHTYSSLMNPATGVGGTDDALDDAVWRLLYKLDNESNIYNNNIDSISSPEGDILFNKTTMHFKVQSSFAGMSLWGPAMVKLILWI